MRITRIEPDEDTVYASVFARWWDELWVDLRNAVHMIRRSPGFTTVAVVSLALGIGADTAIFSLVYTLMLRTLPVQKPARLVELLHRYPGEPHYNGFSWQAYQLFRGDNKVFAGLTASSYETFHVHGEGLASQAIQGGYVDGSFFPTLGIDPALGRLISSNDDRMSEDSAVAVVSWSFWKSKLNANPAMLGKQISVEQVPVTIVGVAPQHFHGLLVESSQDIWLPLALEASIHHPSYRSSARGWLSLLARLNQGVSRQQAQAEMAVLYDSTLEEQAKATNNPFLRKMTLEVEPAGAGLSALREEWARPLVLLLALVGLLLLIACTNLATLLLARGATREHEMALRLSLGAGRLRLARQVLTESLLLAAIGSLFGILLANFGAGTLVRIITAERRPGPPLEFRVQPDWHVLAFTVLTALLTGLLFGAIPALRAMTTTPAPALRQTGNTGGSRHRRFVEKTLVVAQVALSVLVLSASGLFIRQLSDLERSNLGFQRDHVLLVTLDPAGSGYEGEQLSHAYRELLSRLESVPGVRSATICAVTPLSGAGTNRAVNVEGYQAGSGEIRNVMENWVAPQYFKTLGTPLLAGSDFSLQDQAHSHEVIINQTMARYYFGDRNPIGLHLTLDGDTEPYEIIGVVGDAKYMAIREGTYRTVYFNAFQASSIPSHFVLRTSIAPLAITDDVRRAVRDVIPAVSIGSVITLADQIDGSIVPERLAAVISGLFGALGSLLTAIGLYGLLAYTVARRVKEIGVRMALGASRRDMARMVLSDALTMVLLGLAIGAPIAFWCRTFAASVIQDLPTNSALPIALGMLAMIAVALAAAYIPVRRASRVDPMAALRCE